MLVSVHRYSSASPWNNTDQIGVSGSMWQRLYLDEGAVGHRPVFVRLGGVVVGRIRPEPALMWEPGRVDVPEWMWLLLGAPDTGAVLDLDVEIGLHNVGHLVLKPRGTLRLEDPVTTLTAELSSGRWAVLMAGMELVLDCGTFDVMSLRDAGGEEMLAGCILDQDVGLEFVGVPTTPSVSVPVPGAVTTPTQSTSPISTTGGGMTFLGMTQQQPRTSGYIPFGGQGHRLT